MSTVKHPHPHPAEGGAYERQADGTLVLIERTGEAAAQTAEPVPPVEPPPAPAASVRKRKSA